MFRALSLSTLGYLAVASVLTSMPGIAIADGSSKVEITVTNITRGQIISPVVVASHRSGFEPLFVLGEPASVELAGVAEDADLPPMIASLEADPDVLEVETLLGAEGPIMPGESASITIDVTRKARFLSMVAMLVTTNDAFFALRGVRVPWHGSSVHRSPAYDSGSEANSEDCDFIPGPPCGNHAHDDTAEAEGYVHIHAGVHGIADLDPAIHDWRNPVATVRIRRVR